jgi:FkbM family methyltransferase
VRAFTTRITFLHRAWRYRWAQNPAQIRWLLAHVTAGQTLLDVGAHKGAYSYWMLRATGRQGRVVSFEPQPRLADYLMGVREMFGWRNWQIETCGVSDHRGTSTLRVPSGGTSPGASLEDKVDVADGDVLTVRLVTLDDYIGTARVGLMKIDVEGHELAVLNGARRLLERDRPAILLECEKRHRRDGTTREVFGFLKSLGYQGAFFRHGRPHPLSAFDEPRDQADPRSSTYVGDFCFTCPTRSPAVGRPGTTAAGAHTD